MDYQALKMFDYVLVYKDNQNLREYIMKCHYAVIMEQGDYPLHKNLLPSTELN